jgi:hypothetical protein
MIVFKNNPSIDMSQDKILDCIQHFKNSGKDFVIGQRNAIKIFEIEGQILNIKSFRVPNFINRIIYRFFRKSKAARSFEYATILMNKGIGTPKPIAFYECFNLLGLKESYYVCEHINADLTYRELVQTDYPDGENILRQFTRFSFEMHQKGIEFLDHSPGNTLIKNEGNGNYSFYLVDLNRMRFHETLDFQTRMKNLSRLTPKKEMIVIMSNEYAKLSGENENTVFETMWKFTEDFQSRFHRKKRIKKKLKFWKK